MTSSLAGLLEVFDVTAVGDGHFVGGSDAGDRDLIDASQLLAQAIVAAGKSCPDRAVRRADGVFCRPVRAQVPIDFALEMLQAGRTFTTCVVTASQEGRACATMSLLLDVPVADVIRHPVVPATNSPQEAIPYDMPLDGRELRLVDVVDPNDPDDVGPAFLAAWVRYSPPPSRPDLARALLAHFTGHLSISATMRGHPGVGTAMSHRTLSTAVMAIGITFHEPVQWDGWLLYEHESTFVGSGMAYVRGQIRDESGRPLASFTQDGLIRALDQDSAAAGIAERARL